MKNKEVYAVFLKLDSYYDDNDKTLEDLFDSEEKAVKYISDRPYDSYVYEKWRVY